MKKIYLFYILVLTISGAYAEQKNNDKKIENTKKESVADNDFSAFTEVPLSWVKPEGWLRGFLQMQKEGLTGNIEVAGFPFSVAPWQGILTEKDSDPVSANWWPYEQTGYWVDGALKCGYLLGDKELIERARKNIDYVIEHQAADGTLGPLEITSRWPQAVFFRALMAEYSATKDPKIINALVKHYLNNTISYSKGRNVMNVENICWLYHVTGDIRILKRAEQAYEDFCKTDTSTVSMKSLLSEDIPDIHGVTFNEALKLPVILYQATGNKAYLKAAQNGFDKLDKYHVMVDGMPTSSEKLYGNRSNYIHETCNVSDYSWSTGYMLMATGDTRWADRIEQVCFNAGIGSVTKDFKAHQYYSSPNQVLATDKSCQWNADEEYYAGTKDRMTFRPGQSPKCCTGNVNRFMPNYVSRMWLSGKSGEIVAAMYGPSEIIFPQGKSTLRITEKTDYPFSERIDFILNTDKTRNIPLIFRIPGWCNKATILVNGAKTAATPVAGSFFRFERLFSNGDTVTLLLTMNIKPVITDESGVAVQRGPLLYSLPVSGSKKIVVNNYTMDKRFPSYEMTPESRWAYAVKSDEIKNQAVLKEIQMPLNPWLPDQTPVKISIPAYQINNWNIEKSHTPMLPVVYNIIEKSQIELVPMGCTELRISVFPNAGTRIALKD